MDKEIEHKVEKKAFLENKTGLPDCKVIEETIKQVLKKISSRKTERNMDRLNISLKNHKYIKKTTNST